MELNQTLNPRDLVPAVERALGLATEKTLRLDRRWKASDGAPVITFAGRYVAPQLDPMDAGLSIRQCPALLRHDRR